MLQLPLAMAALPIVLNVSHFYGKHFAVNLTLIGVIFLLTRLIDAIQDPLIGYFSDRLTHRKNGRLWMAVGSVPILGIGFFAVFSPPDLTGHAMLLYLLLALIVVHLGYSGVSISYHSLGAELSYDYNERTRVTVWREVFGILGLLLGAALPPYLVTLFGELQGHARLAVTFLPLLLVPAILIWVFKPRPVTPPVPKNAFSISRVFVAPFRNKRFRTLLAVYLINGSAVAIAASVVLFFIDDIVEAPQHKVWFILAYFASGMFSVPFWLWLSKRTSKSGAWFAGIIFSSGGLALAMFVGAGDVTGYLIVCVLAGFGLGADYGLPPAILADVIHNEVSDSQGESGKYFGLWAMATKITTAIGGGIALPMLDVLGYTPGSTDSSWALIAVYAALPAFVKLLAVAWLWRIRVESAKPSVRKQWRQYRRPISRLKSERT
jgi:GPH family glycoside/pentoside/hexuronide:cation symporter